jgi:hypothetical protein
VNGPAAYFAGKISSCRCTSDSSRAPHGVPLGANTIADLPEAVIDQCDVAVMAAYSEYAQTEATASPGLQHVCALDLLQYWQPSAYPVAAHREPVEDAP